MTNKKQNWVYSDIVKDHFLHPRNLLSDENEEKMKFDGVGEAGSMVCGDIMRMYINIKNGKILDCKWRTFGCASAIASTSILSEMVTENGGMKIEEALKIKSKDIVERLGGLPMNKIHCSVLGDQALANAIKDYEKKK